MNNKPKVLAAHGVNDMGDYVEYVVRVVEDDSRERLIEIEAMGGMQVCVKVGDWQAVCDAATAAIHYVKERDDGVN